MNTGEQLKEKGLSQNAGDMKLTHDGEELCGDSPLHPEQCECDAVQCGDHHGQPVGEDGGAV